MKKIFFVVLLLLIVSCTSQVEIKNSENKKNNNAYIRTTRVDISNETAATQGLPAIKIIFPANRDIINGSSVVVKLVAENFSVVPIGSPVKDKEGHFHVWLDSEKRVTTESTILFENVASGKHVIVTELVKSDHSSFNPKITEQIAINVENGYVRQQITQQLGADEFTVEADDHGFYPSTIEAKIWDKVKINFKFRDDSIYFAGLDVKGPFPTIQYKLHGKQPVTAEFTMDGPTRIDSYWPSSGVHKATLIVEVEK